MRFLLVCRYYPPHVSGGARRPSLLAKGLRSLGHDVIIGAPLITSSMEGIALPHPAVQLSHQPDQDHSLPQPKPAKWSMSEAIKRPMRYAVLWPDFDRRWADRAYKIIRQSRKLENVDYILTTSPPESIHYIGCRISQETGIKWIADLRDNWLVNPLNPERESALRRIGEQRIAKRWLRHANLITAPRQDILNEAKTYANKTPGLLLRQPSEPNTDSIDRDKTLKSIGIDPQYKIIMHFGQFSKSDPKRHLSETLSVFSNALKTCPNLRLYLFGNLTDTEARQARQTAGVAWLGIQPRQQALSTMRAADGLLIAAHRLATAVPGKLAEYIATQKPIIPVGAGPWLKTAGLEPQEPVNTLISIANGTAKPPPLQSATPNEVATILCSALDTPAHT